MYNQLSTLSLPCPPTIHNQPGTRNKKDDAGNRTKAARDATSINSIFHFTKYYTYDNINQLLTEKKMNQAETSRLYEYQYKFDNAGNRTQMKYFDGSTTQTTNYTYNDLNQMTDRSIWYGDTFMYLYDNNGNMTYEKEHISGDLWNPIRTFGWNKDNRMESAEDYDTDIVIYTYDPMGRRIKRWDTTNNIYTYYYYDGLTVLAEKKKVYMGNPTWDRIFTNGPGAIGNIFRISTWNGNSWDDSYYHYDAIGNVVMKSTSSGGPFTDFEQEAYGNVKSGSQSGYHLTTKEYDSFPELYYFWQRWYDPMLGRFLSTAPYPVYIEHPYVFVNNNPLRFIDTDGLTWWNPISWPFDWWNARTNAANCTHCIDVLLDMRLNTPHIDSLPEWDEQIANCACLCGLGASEVILIVNSIVSPKI